MNTIVNYKIDDELLTDVNAGTFTLNEFPDEVYTHAGFVLNFHFFAKDEFILNGKTYHEDEANAIMKKLGYRREAVTSADGKQSSINYWYKDQIIMSYDTGVLSNKSVKKDEICAYIEASSISLV